MPDRTLRLILGDQFSHDIAAPQEEIDDVPHHKQKIALILSAMWHFATELKECSTLPLLPEPHMQTGR